LIKNSLKKVSKFIPIYPSTYGLTQAVIRTAVEESLKMINGFLLDPLPGYIKEKHKLADYFYSIENIHYPCNNEASGTDVHLANTLMQYFLNA
jgi:RecG-like helicase